MDISALCRSCMKEVASWEKENFDERSFEMFCFCTTIKIDDLMDELPRQFCYDCTIKIESAYIFIKKAQKVNKTFRSIVTTDQQFIEENRKESETMPQDAIVVEIPKSKYKFDHFKPAFKLEFDEDINNYEIEEVVDNNETDTYELSKNEFLTTDGIKKEEIPDNNKPFGIKEKKTFICDYCSRGFQGEFKLLEHLKTYPTHWIGSSCGKSLEYKAQLTSDQWRDHFGKKFSCQYCYSLFKFRSGLSRHIRRQHSEQRRKLIVEKELKSKKKKSQFICNTCGDSFQQKRFLINHLIIHTDASPYNCPQCNKSFKSKYSLQGHSTIHLQKKQHLCSVCGQGFNQSGNLTVHMRRHTGAKPFQCSECSFSSSSCSSIKRHLDRHRGTPRYQCAVCSKTFYDMTGLRRHTRTHTGELPYKCPQCPRAFLDGWKRKSHLMHHHKIPFNEIPKMAKDPTRDQEVK